MTNHVYQYGTTLFEYTLCFHARETVKIVVNPDKTIYIFTPENFQMEKINFHLKKHARWIKQRLNFFNQYQSFFPPRYYISGETHYYLGKQYRLDVSEGDVNSVTLKGGFIFIVHKKNKSVKDLLEKWYFDRAKVKLKELFEKSLIKYNIPPESIKNISVKTLKKRWGSLSSDFCLTLNRKLIFTPLSCCEYVILHEFVHLKYKNHTIEFFNEFSKYSPQWERLKEKLEHFPILIEPDDPFKTSKN